MKRKGSEIALVRVMVYMPRSSSDMPSPLPITSTEIFYNNYLIMTSIGWELTT